MNESSVSPMTHLTSGNLQEDDEHGGVVVLDTNDNDLPRSNSIPATDHVIPESVLKSIQSDDDEDEEDKDEDISLDFGNCMNSLLGRCLRCSEKGGKPCWPINFCVRRLPRHAACCLGVILPLLLLIAFSAIFGYALAAIESPDELAANDVTVAATRGLSITAGLYANATQKFPYICWELYLLNTTADAFWAEIENQVNDFVSSLTIDTGIPFAAGAADEPLFVTNTSNINGTIIEVNTKNVSDYMLECGKSMDPFMDYMTGRLVYFAGESLSGELTFNWNRCPSKNESANSNSTSFDPFNRYQEYLDSLSPVRYQYVVKMFWWQSWSKRLIVILLFVWLDVSQ